MAEQQTRDQAGASESTDDTNQGTHAAPDEAGSAASSTESGGAKGSDASGAAGTASDQAAPDQAAQDQAAQDQPAQEQPAQEQPAQDQASSGRSGQDQPAEDQPAEDQPAQRSPSHPRPQKPSNEDGQAQAAQGDTLTRGHAEEAPTEKHEVPRGRKTRTPIDVREVVWKVASVLATAVRLVGYLFALVLVAFILLTLIGVNPLNGVAQFVGGFAQVVVGPFRDLFLIAEPITSIVVNFGIAAVVWALLGEFVARLVRFAGARLG